MASSSQQSKITFASNSVGIHGTHESSVTAKALSVLMAWKTSGLFKTTLRYQASVLWASKRLSYRFLHKYHSQERSSSVSRRGGSFTSEGSTGETAPGSRPLPPCVRCGSRTSTTSTGPRLRCRTQ